MHTAQHLPTIIIGGGPVGLAAAAQLLERGVTPLVLEAGPSIGHAMTQWGHIRLFSPWRYNIDDAARRLLETTGWTAPDAEQLSTGHEMVAGYLAPLARALGEVVCTDARVIAVSRERLDKTRTAYRDTTPFLVRIARTDGTWEDLRANSVLDASGTWAQPNPRGQAGLDAPGEAEARRRGSITQPLPDITGVDRARFANQHVLVVGAGHSAANNLLALADLAVEAPATRISWAIRGADVTAVYGGDANDELEARGALGSRLRKLVDNGTIDIHTEFAVTGFGASETALTVQADTAQGPEEVTVDVLIPAVGFRPHLGMLSELRLDLDPAVEAPRELGPLIDPEFHSCGSVQPHGERLLAHPETGFYIVGMKSYGRAPTFLMATGYEQVRSIAASLAGDQEAADAVHLELPETGVCTTDLGNSCDVPVPSQRLTISASAPMTSTCC